MICPSCGCEDNLPGSETCSCCGLDLAPLDLPIGQDRIEAALITGCVRDIPTLPPTKIRFDESIETAILRMAAATGAALLVIDTFGELIGILTERDILRKYAGGDREALNRRPLHTIMTPHPETLFPAHSLAFALHKMDIGGYRHLPVVEKGKPIALLSVRHIIEHITGLCRDL